MLTNSDFGRVAVLMGGPSSEREVSLKSGKAVYEALKQRGIDALAMDFNTDKKETIQAMLKEAGVNAAFIALHGRFGEDGSLQGMLEELDIPYTGSGVLASRLAMDKIASRKLFKDNGLNVPKSEILNKLSPRQESGLLKKLGGFPLVVKPSTHGSSIGISFVDNVYDFKKAIDLAFQFDDDILIEQFICGRELTVAVLDEKPLPVIEIISKSKFFDFEAKYKSVETQYIVPAKLDEKIRKSVESAGLAAHQALECQGFSRTDIILDKNNLPFVLEVNTIPGLTSKSLLPKAAASVGIDFRELCLRMLRLAYEKKQLQKNSQAKF